MGENSQLAKLLRERKLKATSTRLEVLSVISDYNKAIPYSEIQNALPGFDRVTLYRTLHALMESGIIHTALKDENETFYATCSKSCTTDMHMHKHIHFKCTACHAVTCVQAANPINLSISGHLIDDFKIEATGVCSSCNY